MKIVVDASIALDWCFESEQTEFANAVLKEVISHGGLVPELWRFEVANGLLTAMRRGRISLEDVHTALRLLNSLKVAIAKSPDAGTLIMLGNEYNLTAYDAAYLAVALQEKALLATNDAALASAGKAVGVMIYRSQ